MKRLALLPEPKFVKCRDGCFLFPSAALRITAADARVENAMRGLYAQYKGTATDDGAAIVVSHGDGNEESYSLDITPDSLIIHAPSARGAYYAVQTLKQLLAQTTRLPCMRIEDTPDFAYRGFYHDVTRGRIPNLGCLKQLADTLALYKQNSLQLYVEHTFAFREYAGICTGQEVLEAEEIRELDAYCRERFIDLVPALSTFGHLYTLLQSEKYRRLCELEDFVPSSHLWLERQNHHTLDPSNPESLRLVRSLIDQYLPVFSSRYFNICCDETFDLCCGRNKGKNKAELYVGFVSGIVSYVESKGRTAMLWGDIVLEHMERLSEISEKAVFLNWDYSKEPHAENAEKFSQSGRTQIVCPGTWGWGRFLEYLPISADNIRSMAALGKAHQAYGLLNTSWGDFGHTCDPLNVAYGRILGAAEAWNTGAPDKETFEQALSVLHYQNENGSILRAVHLLNACDSINVWMQLFYLYDAKEKGAPFAFEGYTAEDVLEKASRSACAASSIEAELQSGGVEKRVGEALLLAARGLHVLLRLLAVMMSGCRDAALPEELSCWSAAYAAQWRRNNKADELPVLLDYLENWKQLLIGARGAANE